MENKTCQYEGCNERVNTPYDESLCVFHASADKKGIVLEEFNEIIWRRINARCFNFKGFIFPGDIIFRGECRKEGGPIVFRQDTDFSKAQFLGDANFDEAQFIGKAKFWEAQFSGEAFFAGAQFARDATFFIAEFLAYAHFIKAQFSGDTDFGETQFSGDADFSETEFSGDADFRGAQFSGIAYFREGQFSGYADFSEAQFSGDVYFEKSHFNDKAVFEGITIKETIFYKNMTLSEKARFYFQRPHFMPEEGHTALVIFDVIQFNPSAVYFENIRRSYGNDSVSSDLNGVLIFRYCQLKDVYFTNNDMTLFSFYKSSFDGARFISSRWSHEKERILFLPFKRKNVIAEERFLSGSLDKDEFRVDDLNGYEDVASLYRRMKTALDNTKDYQQASWFYFNEFEMKRRALAEEIESCGSKISQIFKKIFSKYSLYFCYKLFAGYGEKPLWSFIWFWVLTLIFAFGHIVFGLKYFPGGVVDTKYEFFSFLTDFSIGKFIREFGSAFGYALSQAIPKNYIPYKLSNMNPTNPFGIGWSILNTVVLWILIIFIAIGLKRHFRRF